MFPLHTVLFPQARLPLYIFEPRYRELINRCLREDLAFGVALIKAGAEVGAPAIPHPVGTLARIADVARYEDGRMNIIVMGLTRFKLLECFSDRAYQTARIQLWQDESVDLQKIEPFVGRLAQLFQAYVRAFRNLIEPDEEHEPTLDLPKDPTLLSYLVASNLPVSDSDKQSLLEAPTVAARLRREALFLERELELLRRMKEDGAKVRDHGSFSMN